jgi:putative flavoprotein involved in K+ transport
MEKLNANHTGQNEHYHTIIIGGGQAGLAAGYHLKRLGLDFIILDGNHRTGDSWRHRWESLTLFTPGKFNNLPGLDFPIQGDYLPGKGQVADYLEEYVRMFDLPVKLGVKVQSLVRVEDGYEISAGSEKYLAENVIIATGPFQSPKIPNFSSQLDPSVQQLHSSQYRDPQQITGNSVVIVGAGNSGAEIGFELARAGKQVWLAGRDVGKIPANGPLGRFLGGYPIWWFMGHILSVDTPIGRKVKAQEMGRGTPLGRLNRKEMAASGMKLAPRVSGASAGKILLEDGQIFGPDCVLWATGFCPDYSWIKLPIFDEGGYPYQQKGVIQSQRGLFFIGLPFQTSLSSSLLGGVGADAAYLAGLIGKENRLLKVL